MNKDEIALLSAIEEALFRINDDDYPKYTVQNAYKDAVGSLNKFIANLHAPAPRSGRPELVEIEWLRHFEVTAFGLICRKEGCQWVVQGARYRPQRLSAVIRQAIEHMKTEHMR